MLFCHNFLLLNVNDHQNQQRTLMALHVEHLIFNPIVGKKSRKRNARNVHACDWHYLYGIFIILLVRLQCNGNRCTVVLFMIAAFHADFNFYFVVKIKFSFAFGLRA